MASSYLSPGVYVEEVSSGSKPIEAAGTAVAAFVGFAERGPVDEPVLVTSWTQFCSTFGGVVPGGFLALAVHGYFANGGGSSYVVRLGAAPETCLAAAADPAARLALPAAAGADLPRGDGDERPALTVRAVSPAETDLVVEVQEVPDQPDDVFTLVVKRGGEPVETLEGLSTRRGPTHVVTAVRAQSSLIAVDEVQGRPLAVPRKGAAVALRSAAPAPSGLSAGDVIGRADARTGLAGLEAVDEVTMLCIPDLVAAHSAGLLDDDGLQAVQLAMISHCELMADRVAILDTPAGLSAQQVKAWREQVNYDSKYAALYWPHLKVMNPLTGTAELLPPSGHVAGIWARNDSTRGVHKAPANEVVRGAIALGTTITRGEHDALNPSGINCIRSFTGQGIRVWGARTLSSDPEWRYLNVRRLFNFVEKSILDGTNWVVFESNGPKLWDSVNRTITSFLRTCWRNDAFEGSSPAEAFYVKCDEDNNPRENRDVGLLTVEIGIAPVKPAEFVVFRLSQYADGSGLEE